MEKQKKRKIMIIVCFILFGFCLWRLEKIIGVEETILEQFGDYLKILIEENRIEELEPYVISRFISWEEGGEMADWCPAFHHFFVYEEYDFLTMRGDGGILTAADLNGDGIEDVIEYMEGSYEGYNHASLTIYLGNEEKDYQITYYQPNFDTVISYTDSISVINYQDSIFLILQSSFPYAVRNMAVYQIQEGILTEELKIQYKISSIDTEIAYCKEGMEESVTYYPNYTFEITGERKTKKELEQTADYLVCMEEKEGIKVRIPMIHGLSDQELEEQINQNLEKILLEYMEVYSEKHFGENYWEELTGTAYNSMIATKDYLLFDYNIGDFDGTGERIVGSNLSGVMRAEAVSIFVEIDLKNGEIGLYREFDMEEEFQIKRSFWDRKDGIEIEETLLEEFGEYYKTLMEENRTEEMEQYVISRSVSSEQDLGGLSDTWEVILTAADLNGDGIEDIVEYMRGKSNGLTIYLGKEKKNYQVTYYQPYLHNYINRVDSVFVVNYKNSIFLIIEEKILNCENFREIEIYQIQNGVLTGNFSMNYRPLCEDMKSYNPKHYIYTTYRYKSERKELFPQPADYLICMEKKRGLKVKIPVIYGLSNPELEKEINQNLKKILKDFIKESQKEMPDGEIKEAAYNGITATKDELAFNYRIGNPDPEGNRKDIFIRINLKNGKIQYTK